LYPEAHHQEIDAYSQQPSLAEHYHEPELNEHHMNSTVTC
jgi:hypothetical protein